MGDRSPYVVLGVSEDASFEEIQTARDRLLKDSGNADNQAEVEKAYDSILMQRLRLRQEGKIPVPEGIRFPDRGTVPSPPKKRTPSRPKSAPSPSWASKILDTPSYRDIFLPLAFFAVLTIAANFDRSSQPPVWVFSLGLCVSTYFLFIKEKRFFRSVGWAIAGLFLGLITANAVVNGFGIGAGNPDTILVVAPVMFVMWIITAYLR